MSNKHKILSIKNLQVKFRVRSRILTAIRNVSFDLYDGEILALVGESGSGKSVITKTFTGMLESNGWISEGSIIYQPNELAINDQTSAFKKPIDIVNIQNAVIDKSVVMFVKRSNGKQIRLLNSKIKNILNLNPLHGVVDKAQLKAQRELKINILNQKIAQQKVKAIEFNNRKNAEKLNILEDKIEIIKNELAIIDDENLRNTQIAILEAEILKYKIDTKKLLALNINELNLLKKLINIIETNIADDIMPTNDQILEIDNYFHLKIYLSRFETELQSLFGAIKKNKKLNKIEEQHFLNLMLDWEQINGNFFIKKSRASKALGQIRGKTIATIFQDPMTSLNPLLTVGFQISEVLRKQLNMSRSDAKQEAIKLLKHVGIPNPESRYKDVPGQYSGGMRQRVVIAIALACRPKILICDEPTTALDVTIQAQILKLIKELQQEYHFSVIFITHDLGVVANIADRVAVMYAGQIVEIGTTHEIFKNARHPYTWALLLSLPQLGIKGEKLYSIAGTPPSLFNEIKGDAFAPRNKYALAIDYIKEPPMFQISDSHYAKTWLLHPNADPNIKPEGIRFTMQNNNPPQLLKKTKKGTK